MLSSLMVKAAKACGWPPHRCRRTSGGARGDLRGACARCNRAPCSASRRVDLPLVPRGDGLRVVPDLHELLEHGQQADPEGQGAVPPAADKNGAKGRRKGFLGALFPGR